MLFADVRESQGEELKEEVGGRARRERSRRKAKFVKNRGAAEDGEYMRIRRTRKLLKNISQQFAAISAAINLKKVLLLPRGSTLPRKVERYYTSKLKGIPKYFKKYRLGNINLFRRLNIR